MLGCTFLVCLQRLWYCVPVPWKSKESNNEYLGKISRGNKDIYQTFVRIKTFRVRHQDYRELVVLIYDASLLYTEEMIAESICCRSWIALLTNALQQRMLYSSISLEQCCRIIFGQRAHNWKNYPSPWLTEFRMLTSMRMAIHCGKHYRKF